MIWKDIPTLEDRYQVSNTGLVRSLPRNTTKGKLLKQATILEYKVFGYNYAFKKNKLMKVHRAVAMAFIPNPESKPQVNHINGFKSDNRVENLEWCTSSHNIKHAYSIGLKSSVGEKHNQNILTEAKVLEIRARYIPGKGSRPGNIHELTKEFGVARSTIANIVVGNRWKHLLQETAN